MYLFLFVLWIVLNGKFNLEIALFGIVICGALYWFLCKFMGYSVSREKYIVKCAASILSYLLLLVVEIIKANLATAKMILNFEEEPEPVLVKFTTDLESETAQVVLANSITLTPGTITVDLTDGRFMVHALDEEFAISIDQSEFVRQLDAMEDKAGIRPADAKGSSDAKAKSDAKENSSAKGRSDAKAKSDAKRKGEA